MRRYKPHPPGAPCRIKWIPVSWCVNQVCSNNIRKPPRVLLFLSWYFTLKSLQRCRWFPSAHMQKGFVSFQTSIYDTVILNNQHEALFASLCCFTSECMFRLVSPLACTYYCLCPNSPWSLLSNLFKITSTVPSAHLSMSICSVFLFYPPLCVYVRMSVNLFWG